MTDEVKPKSSPSVFLRSRIFLIAALVIVSMTVLVAIGKLDITESALTTVFLGLVSTVAALSRRGEDYKPVHVVDTSKGKQAMAQTIQAVAPALVAMLSQAIPGVKVNFVEPAPDEAPDSSEATPVHPPASNATGPDPDPTSGQSNAAE